ncbi:MAG: SPFH domain-containing protein, partial [Sphingorhabdus sp.]
MSDFDSRALRSSAERPASTASGYAMLLVALAAVIGIVASATQIGEAPWAPFALVLGVVILAFVAPGFYLLQPNQAAAILLFGDYKGTDRTTGLR